MLQQSNKTADNKQTLRNLKELSPIARLNIERTKKIFSKKENIEKFKEIVFEEYSSNQHLSKPLQQLNSLVRVGFYNPEKFAIQAAKFVAQFYYFHKIETKLKFDNGSIIEVEKVNPAIIYIGEMILKFVKANDSDK
jgi:hypothetical protein